MTDTPTDTWPDPNAPGVPANPERSGPHALKPSAVWGGAMWWSAKSGYWIPFGSSATFAPAQLVEAFPGLGYYGPMLTPAEVAAREAAAKGAGMREAAGIAEVGEENCRMFGNIEGERACLSIKCAILARIPEPSP